MIKIKNNKLPIIMGGLSVITLMGIVYAAFTGQLTINGTANVRDSKWDVHIVEDGQLEPSNTLSSSAKVLTKPVASSNSISDFALSLTTPGDYIEYTFHVVNDGDYDATLSDLDKDGITCTANGSTSDPEAVKVCDKLEYTLKYAGGASVSEGDTILRKETKTMVLRITYEEFDDPSLLPNTNVSISGLGIDINYSQLGDAKVNSDGTTPYDLYDYHVGDRIQVAGDYYRVIANSERSSDYVVALKENPFTVSEIESLGYNVQYNYAENDGTSIAWAGVEYGETSNYNQSWVKDIVNDWVTGTFTNGELKYVDLNNTDYKARLATREELQPIGWPNCTTTTSCYENENTPNWLYSADYWYWTMTPIDSDTVWFIDVDGQIVDSLMKGEVDWFITVQDNQSDFNGVVRPVINVYKSAIMQ